jgi:hypothetical protein
MSTKKRNGAAKKGDPIPTRFDKREEKFLADIHLQTGLGKAEIIRRAGRYAFPKFLSREINIIDIGPEMEVSA